MEMKLVAEKPDQTVYEGEGGGYYAWTGSKSPLLKESKLGAGKLHLRPLGFVIPHFADSSKIAYVLQGKCTIGLVAANSSEEIVVVVKKGDVIPLARGDVSWWFNGGDTDLMVIFLGETTKALVPGEIAYFFLAGVEGILRGFQPDVVAKVFDLDNKEAEDLVSSQRGSVMVKLKDGIEFPKPSEYNTEKVYAAIDTPSADVVVKGGGILNFITEKDFPVLVEMGLSAGFARLEGKAVLAPNYLADGSVEAIYVAKGSGRIRVVGNEGKPSFDCKVEEGELFIRPQFFAGAVIADEGGMELFAAINSSKPIMEPLGGKMSAWKALSSVVIQSAFNISLEFEQLFKSKNEKKLLIIPSRS